MPRVCPPRRQDTTAYTPVTAHSNASSPQDAQLPGGTGVPPRSSSTRPLAANHSARAGKKS